MLDAARRRLSNAPTSLTSPTRDRFNGRSQSQFLVSYTINAKNCGFSNQSYSATPRRHALLVPARQTNQSNY